MTRQFPLGKIPADLLSELLGKVSKNDPRIIVGPGIGLDAAVIDMGDRYLVAKTDPITFATDQLGWYAVHVNANDVACMGAVPRWFLATLLMPEGDANETLARDVFKQITQACGTLEVSLVGGHTETTFGIDRPLIVGCMLGEVSRDHLLTPSGIKVGDVLILAGQVPIEATAIIGREKSDELKQHFGADFITRCANYLNVPGISVVRAAQAAQSSGEIHAMHDPTEGGLATGLWELAQASQTKLVVREDDISVAPEGRVLCEHYGLDPLSIIASGALLIAVPRQSELEVIAGLVQQKVFAAAIGEVVEQGDPGVTLIANDGRRPLNPPQRDEITKLFESP